MIQKEGTLLGGHRRGNRERDEQRRCVNSERCSVVLPFVGSWPHSESGSGSMWRAVVIVGVAIAECFRVTAAQLSKAPPWYDAGIPWWLAFPPEKEINAHYKNSKPLVGSRTLPIHPDQHTALLRAGAFPD